MTPLRGLTLVEYRKCRAMSENEADIAAVAWSCGVLPAEAEAWMNRVTAGECLRVVQAIMELSGLTEGAVFQGSAGDDAGPAQPAQ